MGEGERAWVERQMGWFLAEFGAEPLLREPVLPTAAYFPGPFHGSAREIRALVVELCGYFDVEPGRLQIEVTAHDDGEDLLAAELGLTVHSTGAAGHFRWDGGRPVVTIDQEYADRPVALVATIAHELCHVKLLAEERIDPDRPDGEPLTDLLTVHHGFGVFNANSVFTRTTQDGRVNRRWLGYLSQQQFGYALACYAHLRGESAPRWARHLDPNPRGYLKQGLRFLAQHPLPYRP